MQSKIDKIYLRKTGVLIPYEKDGKPNAIKHRLNSRGQDMVEEVYMQRILKDGMMQAARGRPKYTPSLVEGGPVELITCGTTTSAVYRAKAKDPENPFVKATLAAGLVDCDEYDNQTPDDVLCWMRDVYNKFHQGSRTSLIERCEKVKEIEDRILQVKAYVCAIQICNQI